MHNVLDHFHPAVANWFRRTYTAPTEPQVQAWPVIQSGQHVLIAAPTGSGKTLAAFWPSTSGATGRAPSTERNDQVVTSPLKALSNDIHKNPGAARRHPGELVGLGFP
jgi:ATP-dependent Lhr-like helicase